MPEHPPSRNLGRARLRLLAGLGALAVVSAGAIGLALGNDYSRRTAEVRERVAQDAVTSAGYISAELDRQIGGLTLIANSAVVQKGDQKEIENYFKRIRSSGSLTNGLWFVTSDGKVRAATTASAGLTLGDRPYVARALAGEKVVGEPVTGRVSGRPFVPLGVPVTVDGQVDGAVFTQAPLDDPATFGRALGFLTHDAKIQTADGVALYENGPIQSFASQSGGGPVGESGVATTQLIPGSPGWTVTVSEPESSAYAQARGYLLRGGLAVGIGLLITLVLLWRAWRTILHYRDRERASHQQLQAALEEGEERRRRSERIGQLALEMERHQGFDGRADALVESLLDGFADFAIIEATDVAEPGDGDREVRIHARHIDPQKDPVIAELRHAYYEAQPPHKETSGGRLATRPFRMESEPASHELHAHGRALWLLNELQPGSIIGVPLRTAHGGRASLVVGRAYGQPSFADADMEFLESLGTLAGLVLEAGILHDLDRHRSLYLQENLLPPDLPDEPAFRVDACYQPSERGAAAGGDWYDAYRMPGPYLLLTIGDVVGHGVEAAAAMGKLRSALRALAETSTDPALMLQTLDRLAAPMRSALCATAFVGVLDVETGRLTYSNAGHPLPVLVTRHQASTLDGTDDLPLAVEQRERHVAEVALTDGDLLVLFTDGLIETRDDDLDARADKMKVVVENYDDRLLPELLDGVLRDMAPDGTDDVCLLALRWTPIRR